MTTLMCPHDGWMAQGPVRPLGVERALPVAFHKGQAQFPSPNRPGPARGDGTLGLQPELYAEVARRGIAKKHPRITESPAKPKRDRQGQTKSKNPTFGLLVRKLHSIIKVVHHQRNVDSRFATSVPPLISRMISKLATLIKPVIPDEDIMDAVVKNARRWGQETIEALTDHYAVKLTVLLSDLRDMSTQDWETAFQVATGWARKNLPRITDEVIRYAEECVKEILTVHGQRSTSTPAPRTEDAPPKEENKRKTTTKPKTNQDLTVEENPKGQQKNKNKRVQQRPKTAKEVKNLPQNHQTESKQATNMAPSGEDLEWCSQVQLRPTRTDISREDSGFVDSKSHVAQDRREAQKQTCPPSENPSDVQEEALSSSFEDQEDSEGEFSSSSLEDGGVAQARALSLTPDSNSGPPYLLDLIVPPNERSLIRKKRLNLS